MTNDYRFDVRSKTEFKKDIKSSHAKELQIAVRLCIAAHAKTGIWPELIPNGIDMSGEFIDDPKKVSAKPDFMIAGRLVEITRADTFCKKVFHEKCPKIHNCIENNFDLVFVNGFGVDKQPKYVRLNPEILKDFTQRAISKYGKVLFMGAGKTGAISKQAYRYDLYWFTEADLWKPLPALCKDIPKEYKDILNLIKT